ncbi:PRPF31 [Branchiostoma lanceolatum]|uniref:Nucleolar protein 56 n=1 Tax=Branchiostoma lanceolatum TaxID=7740 RepID=A0A8J9ZNE4_BRALA|nr:PRPF31 [Branchiostoma lanceolatum]
MAGLHVLYEHASGYALFRVEEVEEVGMLLPTVEKSVKSYEKFNSTVKLVAFSPFKSGTNALDNCNAISEGILHDDLKVFLENSFPLKKKKATLGIADSKIGSAIQEELGIPLTGGDVVQEVIRGIKLHFHLLVKGLTETSASKAQLGLGHSYSRAKVKFNVHRADNMIIQSISLLDQLDKDINTFSMRIREWYSYHFPELVKVVNDNYMYARLARIIGDRKLLKEDRLEELEEITMDSAKAEAIIQSAKSSMGMDISPIDLINIETFASRVVSLAEYRKSLHAYLQGKMHNVAPNLSALIGEQVGARLISHAGSLTNLAKYPASTVQILGAEKALFRALKTRGNTPKYGLIFHSTFIGRAGAKNKGRISRYLANKCSIASRVDCFADVPTDVIGNKLRDQVEERLSFYETGTAPRKNIDVMKEALSEMNEMIAKKRKEDKKKKKKRKLTENGDHNATTDGAEEEETPARKKKKGQSEGEQSAADVSLNQSTITDGEGEGKKKKKKKKQSEAEATVTETEVSLNESAAADGESDGKKKKKKKKKEAADPVEEEEPAETPKKKKKKQAEPLEESMVLADDEGEPTPKKEKKKKKKDKK